VTQLPDKLFVLAFEVLIFRFAFSDLLAQI
jgi:hypothetical protein